MQQPPPEGFDSWQDALAAFGVPEELWNSRAALIDPDGAGPRVFIQQVPEGESRRTGCISTYEQRRTWWVRADGDAGSRVRSPGRPGRNKALPSGARPTDGERFHHHGRPRRQRVLPGLRDRRPGDQPNVTRSRLSGSWFSCGPSVLSSTGRKRRRGVLQRVEVLLSGDPAGGRERIDHVRHAFGRHRRRPVHHVEVQMRAPTSCPSCPPAREAHRDGPAGLVAPRRFPSGDGHRARRDRCRGRRSRCCRRPVRRVSPEGSRPGTWSC